MNNLQKTCAACLLFFPALVFSVNNNPASAQYVENAAASAAAVFQQTTFTSGAGVNILNMVISGNYAAGNNGVSVNNTTGTISGGYTAGTGVLISSGEISATASLSVGDLYQGGIVFYLDDTGRHGLAVSTVNQSDSVAYADSTGDTPETPTNGVGAGLSNTIVIVTVQAVQGFSSSNAANAAITFARQSDGTTDCLTTAANPTPVAASNCFGGWYLGSASEYALLLANITAVNTALSAITGATTIDTTSNTIYWTSTSANNDLSSVFNVNFTTGAFTAENYVTSTPTHVVRAIRQF